jgi:hypothetical protein
VTPEEIQRKADRAEGKASEGPEREYQFSERGTHPGGRPTKYKAEFAKQAAKLCALGATNADLADFFDVSTRTVDRWQAEHIEFNTSVKEAKETADARVERGLYQRAVGYSHDAVKIFMPAGADEPVYAHYREQLPPDTSAAVFWLKNRRPEEWRDKVISELTGKDGGPIETRTNFDLSHLDREDRATLRGLLLSVMAKGSGNGQP